MSERQSFLQEFPSFKAVRSQLYKKRRELIPKNPTTMKELETDLPWFLLNQEQIVKGDRVFEDGRRIIFMTTDYHLDMLARAPG